MEICIASNNAHKVQEIKAMLPGGIILTTLKEEGIFQDLAEDQATLEGNAHQKAAFVAQTIQKNCFADDTGLEVSALGGAPGVFSARYAGAQRSDADNMALLLQNLSGISDRKAQFRTVICLFLHSKTYYFEGILEGEIGYEPRGNQGFGYDPIFIPKGENRTLAEMTLDEKNKISHRAKATEKLVSFLKDFTSSTPQ